MEMYQLIIDQVRSSIKSIHPGRIQGSSDSKSSPPPNMLTVFIDLHMISISQYHMTLVQGRVFSADPLDFGLSYFQCFSRFPPSVPIVDSETQSSDVLFGPVVRRGTFRYDVEDVSFIDSLYRFAGILPDGS